MLDTYKSGHSDNPFFYKEGHAIIASRSADGPKMDQIITELGDRINSRDSSFLIHSFDGRPYLITYYYSNILEWHLVDSVPLNQIIGPIKQQRLLFGASSIILLLSCITAASALYWNVHRPIFQLVRAVQRIKEGDYAYRLPKKSNNEFTFLMQNFNEMATQIQDLIENVLQSRILARDATLKQLQAQIHPHFLYNCLGFIINMTKMGKNRAVIDMAYHLADYYRYTTRMDNQGVSLGKNWRSCAFTSRFFGFAMRRCPTASNCLKSWRSCEFPGFLSNRSWRMRSCMDLRTSNIQARLKLEFTSMKTNCTWKWRITEKD